MWHIFLSLTERLTAPKKFIRPKIANYRSTLFPPPSLEGGGNSEIIKEIFNLNH